MKAFYHSADLDGHCSGAIIKLAYPDCELIGINYGDEFPWDSVKGQIVYMADFSLQPFSDMERLGGLCDLVWIDHHKTALESYGSGKCVLAGQSLREGIGACQLVWEYFFDSPVPEAVRLLAEYDVWNRTDPKALPFQFGMRLYDTIPEVNMEFWENVFSTFPESIITEGVTILRYNERQNEIYCSACSFETEIDGLRCIAINRMLTNSQIFESVWDAEKYDAMLSFGFRKGSWIVSLYSDKEDVDVSVVAKNRGGGGHKGAAGFQCSELPFRI